MKLSEALELLDEKKKKKKSKKKKSSQAKGLWYHVNRNKRLGKRPKRPGEKGYPDKETWDELKGESLLREAIQDTLAALDKPLPDVDYSTGDAVLGPEPETIGHDDKRLEAWLKAQRAREAWLKSLDDEYVEAGMDETSGGQDRPLSSIR